MIDTDEDKATHRIFCLCKGEDKAKAMDRAFREGTTLSKLMRQWLKAYIQEPDPAIELKRLKKELHNLAERMGASEDGRTKD